jgi:hypothetical protein
VTQQINLFNPIFLRQKKYFSFITILQGLALLLIGVLGFYAYATYHMGQLSKEVQEVSKRLELEKGRFSKAGKEFGPRQKNKELEMQIKDLEKQVQQRESILGIQAGSGGHGFSEYLRAFARQSVNGLWLTSFRLSASGNTMVIGGRALRADLVPDYIKRLGNEKIMHGQPFSSLDMRLIRVEKVGGYFEFNLNSVEQQQPGSDPGKVVR